MVWDDGIRETRLSSSIEKEDLAYWRGAWSVREDTQIACMCFASCLYWIILTEIG